MFLAVGGCGYILNTAVLHLLHIGGGIGITTSSAIATELAIVFNFVGHNFWTFAERRVDHGAGPGPPATTAYPRRFLHFQLASLLSASVTVLTLTAIHTFGLPLPLSNALAVAAGSALNLTISSNLIWKPTRSEVEAVS